MTQEHSSPHIAAASEAADVVRILVGAFNRDPLWSWALPDAEQRPAQLHALWQLFVEGAMRYPWVWLTGDKAATSVWLPPGGTELSEEKSQQLEHFLRDLLGNGADRVIETFDAFERVHPPEVPHFYLSLLGTDPEQLGHGHGLALLGENLRMIDEVGAPAYLEASNVGNVALYERFGFHVIGAVQPQGGPEAMTMWREPRTSPTG